MVSLKLSLLLSLALASPAFAQNDEPDLGREQRLHDIYTKFNETPTSDQAWTGAINGKVRSYSVQKGDTLWGVSETLFADPQFWPKIWSLNVEGIENPHEIFPEQAVQFTPGSMGEPPRMAVADKAPEQQASTGVEGSILAEEETPEQIQARKEKVEADIMSNFKLPPPLKKYAPLMKLPLSIPLWGYRQDERQKLVFDPSGRIPRSFPSPIQILPYFLAESENSGAGTIVETEMTFGSASEYQYVFVKLNDGVNPGPFLVVKDQGSIKDKGIFAGKGYITQVQGMVDVLEKVNTDKNIYRALVKKTVAAIEVGGILVAQPLPTYDAQESATLSSATARIVGGAFADDRKLFGTSNIVYLIGQGMSENQTYPVFKNQTIRDEKTKALENRPEIGRVKVVKVIGEFGTGVILNSSDDIHVGDSTFESR